jgi:N-methylhydantoinase A
MTTSALARVAVDIGGTFTDLVLEQGSRQATAKLLTTPDSPERAVIEGIGVLLKQTELRVHDIGLVVHGTTLATNALIERKGARTALITTEGFRDSLEIGYENRFEQYDAFIDKPEPLVPRYLRFGVPERIDAQGQVRLSLDTERLLALVAPLRRERIESLAIGFLHSYANPAHEQAAREMLATALPGLSITLSSEVCPEAREYERFSTACANAYVQPRMARYLAQLRQQLEILGLRCPLLLMTSGGGLTTLETARRFPIRLVESGPAGGAILASEIARRKQLAEVVSFDMGGTTAKICLVDNWSPQAARQFEVDRRYRFLKGSGLPVRIPVVEMVEIGAGGGSIAAVDEMGRITVGPESAGADPGPACYARGGTSPTVTDADLALGRIDLERFAGGRISLAPDRAQSALERSIGTPLGLDLATAAFGVSEMVEETMANAARVHAVERGKDLAGRTLIAFGGGAPLHAARLAEKLGIHSVLIPSGAGVGSAIGFLHAPVAFEIARSRFMRLSTFAASEVNDIFAAMEAEAVGAVRLGAPQAEVRQQRAAEMRYAGQGHEIVVPLPVRAFASADVAEFRARFEAAYTALFGRFIPNLDLEVVSWTLRAEAVAPQAATEPSEAPPRYWPEPTGHRPIYDVARGAFREVPVFPRAGLRPGAAIAGPAVIPEDATTIVVTEPFVARVEADGAVRLQRKDAKEAVA